MYSTPLNVNICQQWCQVSQDCCHATRNSDGAVWSQKEARESSKVVLHALTFSWAPGQSKMLPPRLFPHRRTPWAPRVTTTQCKWASKGRARAIAVWRTSSNLDGSSSDSGNRQRKHCGISFKVLNWPFYGLPDYLWASLLLFMSATIYELFWNVIDIIFFL